MVWYSGNGINKTDTATQRILCDGRYLAVNKISLKITTYLLFTSRESLSYRQHKYMQLQGRIITLFDHQFNSKNTAQIL
jgi:hypothetical protein